MDRMNAEWGRFMASRADRLRHGREPEKVAEEIAEDLFTEVLDWEKGDLLYQEQYADIVLSRNLVKFLVVEVKRPGAPYPRRQSLVQAVGQARRYADAQKVSRIAATDGCILYAADIEAGGITDRVFLDLAAPVAPPGLWWLSVHGIYRPCQSPEIASLVDKKKEDSMPLPRNGGLLHPRYQLPVACFAYVGDANDPATWKLPYLTHEGCTDLRRLPKAIQALVSNYRGAKVTGIPESAIRAVLLRLARAAAAEGRLPPHALGASPVYVELAHVLDQLGLTAELAQPRPGAGDIDTR